MIFVDSSGWFAVYSLRDVNHARVSNAISTCPELLVTSDYVVDETLTLLRARRENERALVFGNCVVDGGLASIVSITTEDFLAAWNVFQKFHDKEWSFTDCTSYVVMQRLGIQQAFAFDDHFRQLAPPPCCRNRRRQRGRTITLTYFTASARISPSISVCSSSSVSGPFTARAG